MKIILPIVLLTGIFSVCCEISSVNSQQVENTKRENVSVSVSNEVEDKTLNISDYYTQEDSLEYKGYVIRKIAHKEKPEGLTEAVVTDAVIQKNGKTLLKFDGIYYGLGNATDFGLFPFLGENEKQLVVSHTIPRGGAHYVIDFSPDPKVIFNSESFEIFGEDFGIKDIDSDGIYEISLVKSVYYFNFASSETPFTRIIFKFDNQTEKFLPANHKFPEFKHKEIDDQIKRFNESKDKRFSDVLGLTLTYIYAGRENEGWKFFDENFAPDDWALGKVEDKEQTKEKIKAALKKEAIYKFIKDDFSK